MEQIKIISNPYKKEIQFEKLNENNKKWEKIDNSNSKLLNSKLRHSFFAFKVPEIINILVQEYGQDGVIEIDFEGTFDDYKQLQLTCENAENIQLKEHKRCLNNADFVLPKIVDIFHELDTEISEFGIDSIKDSIERFLDVTKELVPLCVIGNYSAGKSTFINALIGREILPSGNEPTTAKIYKIYQSDENVDVIKFTYQDHGCKICIQEGSYSVDNEELNALLIEKVKETNNNDVLIYQIIDTLNGCEYISDIVEVHVKFNGGMWNMNQNRFVILDTPGFNSASHEEHEKLLSKALKGLTNGLPIFISRLDTLDARECANYYDFVMKLDEIDNRFSFIIVNRADDCSLPDEGYFTKEKEVDYLNEAIPKRVYTEGIFFVSSIMGLGSKIQNGFVDTYAARTFKLHKSLFEDKDNEYYLSLYRYNIMPQQLKKQIVDEATHYQENLIYVNSGLFSVESEIMNFANKYSAYNKCEQATKSLDQIIQVISQEIDLCIDESERRQKQAQQDFDENKKTLIQEILQTCADLKDEFMRAYDTNMQDYMNAVTPKFHFSELKNTLNQYIEQYQMDLNLDQKNQKIMDSIVNMKDGVMTGIDGVIKEKTISKLKTLGSSLSTNLKKTVNTIDERQKIIKNANEQGSNKVFEKVTREFEIKSDEAQKQLNEYSRNYWLSKTMEIRNSLTQIINGASILESDKKEELGLMVSNYSEIILNKDIPYNVQEYVPNITVGDKVIFQGSKLFVSKVILDFNKAFDDLLADGCIEIKKSHKPIFEQWQEELLNEVVNNITEYSPVLAEKKKIIEEGKRQISKLKQQQNKVQESVNYINQLKSWRNEED